MKQRRRRTAVGFGLVWLLVALAGADHPPPLGFLWLLPVLMAMAGLVYWRWPHYARWKAQAAAWRALRVTGEGAVAGVALAVVLGACRTPAMQAPQPSAVDVGIWFLVLVMLGIGHAWLVYGLAPRAMEEVL